jgi:hypothetical protein
MKRTRRRYISIGWFICHEDLPPWQRHFLIQKMCRGKYSVCAHRRLLRQRAFFLVARKSGALTRLPTVRDHDGCIYMVLSPGDMAPWSDFSPFFVNYDAPPRNRVNEQKG